jgi:hypothetical protein
MRRRLRIRRVVIITAVFSLVVVSFSAASAMIGSPVEEVVSGDVALAASPTPAAITTPAAGHLPDNDRARGLVFDGLRPGRPDGPCAGGFEMTVDGETLCTPGPDRAPDHVDVRRGRPTSDLAQTAAATSSDAAAANAVPVIGDGISGNRVQAIYAVAADRPDRYGEIAPLIAQWAAHMDAKMNESAALTGGERHIRFVTDAAGSLDVEKVILASDADDTFGATISALKSAGYNDPGRKYLIWMDASIYCGIANLYGDDKPTQDNYNNGRFAQYARVDTGCWGHNNSVELHELVHTLGAIQQSAPHSTPGWHCTDEYDRMCYKDSSTVTMNYVCDISMEGLLDCGHEDYFNTSPAPGSYLASHWNTANSSFLEAGPVGDPPPPPPNTAPEVTATGPATVTLPDGAALDGTVTDDGLPAAYTVAWSKVSGQGTVTFADESAEDTTATFSSAGAYVLRLTADDGELIGEATVSITVEDAAVPNTAPEVTAIGPATVTLPDGAALDGTVTDDGLPAAYTVAWSKVSGEGTVSFADVSAEDTTATFSIADTYVLKLTADDGDLTGDDTVTIVVENAAVPNAAPEVTATGPAAVTLPNAAALNGTVTDDGMPNGSLTTTWSKVSGQGTVTFADASAEDTTADFSAPGTYVLKLMADDGEMTGEDTVTIVVAEEEAPPPDPDPEPVTEVFEGSLNKKWPARTFVTTVADGPAQATLTFSGKGKKAQGIELTLNVYDAAGEVVTSVSGPSQLDLPPLTLEAGTYTWEVTGGRISFSLSVTYMPQ